LFQNEGDGCVDPAECNECGRACEAEVIPPDKAERLKGSHRADLNLKISIIIPLSLSLSNIAGYPTFRLRRRSVVYDELLNIDPSRSDRLSPGRV
jgi:hypothetical protein